MANRANFGLSFIIISIFLFISSAQSEDNQNPKPALSIDSSVFEFGNVAQGEKITHDFIIRNKGNADLKIERVVPACGCTAGSASTDLIPPGGEGKIHVEFDTTGFTGSKYKSVRIYTNDPDATASMVALKGNIEQDVEVSPPNLFFGDVIKGEGASKEVTIKVRASAKDRIKSVVNHSKYIDVAETESGDKSRKFVVSIKKDTPITEIRDRVVIELDGGARSSINMPVYASIKGFLEIMPSTVSFGLIDRSNKLTRSVRLINKGRAPIKIGEISADSPAVNVSSKTVKDGEIYELDVTIDPSKIIRNLKSTVDVTTSSKEEEKLSFNVFGVLAPKQ